MYYSQFYLQTYIHSFCLLICTDTGELRREVRPDPSKDIVARGTIYMGSLELGGTFPHPACRGRTSPTTLSTSPPSKTLTPAQPSPPRRQLSAGEGSCRPPATIYDISLTDGAGRVLLPSRRPQGTHVSTVSRCGAASVFSGSGLRRWQTASINGWALVGAGAPAHPPRRHGRPASSGGDRQARRKAPASELIIVGQPTNGMSLRSVPGSTISVWLLLRSTHAEQARPKAKFCPGQSQSELSRSGKRVVASYSRGRGGTKV